MQKITSGLAAFLLFVSVAMVGAAHGGSHDCPAGHCADTQMMHGAIAGIESLTIPDPEKTVVSDFHASDTGSCNPFLCNLATLIVQNLQQGHDMSKAVLGAEVANALALRSPDGPERPPRV